MDYLFPVRDTAILLIHSVVLLCFCTLVSKTGISVHVQLCKTDKKSVLESVTGFSCELTHDLIDLR